MHIGLILSQPPGYSETFFKSKIKGLQASGYRVSLYVQKTDSTFKTCKVYKLPKVYKNTLFQLFALFWVLLRLMPYARRVIRFVRLEQEHQRENTQILKNIYINANLLKSNVDWLHFGFATLVLQREHVAKAIGAKMAVSLRGFDIDVYPMKHPNCYATLWQNVDKVHAISKYTLNQGYYHGLPETVASTIITPAVKWVNTEQRNASKTTKIITVGRLHWMKGYLDILEALSLLKTTSDNFHYQIIGIGPEEEAIKFTIHQLGLQNHVTLLGQQSHDSVFKYIEQAEVYLQYSHSEGFCNAVLEAQALGKLCVVSDGGGLPENIIDGETGWVVPKRQPKLLAKTLESVIALDATVKSQFSKQAKARVQHQFTLEQQRAKFVEFYKTKY
ncbi:glycosyltransferase family 4 protein [Winogradskyella sediminis]|uniref:glycosyltransferase family 4 protein n=1 Tax=Winogradskyella sediminis TaxID=1382466 RepID=UPI000E25EBB9|nr:glycosyltransferase family 4 protein [Winogradskyella sediminis]REG87730.1 colanic acid/amylovoran biosynthesis glycosyltransferase [Winogradskyella sediminis]